MALNGSGPISLGGSTAGQSVNLELGQSATTTVSFNDTNVRTLTGTTAGTALSMPGGFWGKSNNSSLTIASNQTDLNLRTWAVANGWDGSSAITVTISAGIYIYATATTNAGLTIDGSWPGGITLVNNGYIMGKGGNGSGDATNTPGAGGAAIQLGVNASIVNNSFIGGGGGGGQGFSASTNYVGGGGGAGGGNGGNSKGGSSFSGTLVTGGSGGTAGSSGSAGGTATGINAGSGGGRVFPGLGGGGAGSGAGFGGGAGGGGGSGYLRPTLSVCIYGGAGGGGGWGAAGGVYGSTTGDAPGTYSGGAGGAAGAVGVSGSYDGVPGTPATGGGGAGGKAIALSGYSATLSGSGTIYGAVS